MPPSVTTKGGTLSRVMARPCDSQPQRARRRSRRARRDTSHSRRVLPVADGEAVRQAALGDRGRDQAGEGEQRADRKVDAGGQDDEGHADREQAGDRDLPHDVEEVDRTTGSAARRWRRPPSARCRKISGAKRASEAEDVDAACPRLRPAFASLMHVPVHAAQAASASHARHHRHQHFLRRLGRARSRR